MNESEVVATFKVDAFSGFAQEGQLVTFSSGDAVVVGDRSGQRPDVGNTCVADTGVIDPAAANDGSVATSTDEGTEKQIATVDKTNVSASLKSLDCEDQIGLTSVGEHRNGDTDGVRTTAAIGDHLVLVGSVSHAKIDVSGVGSTQGGHF